MRYYECIINHINAHIQYNSIHKSNFIEYISYKYNFGVSWYENETFIISYHATGKKMLQQCCKKLF